ncbi:MAG: Tetratricopeptide 1 repeat-containing protein [Bacteroidota bacterium]|jgi:Tfp pilus assembly protein PilF|nr:Tetratricopeptide 1 repeat-containing protein [Bacteroidota bacterium]
MKKTITAALLSVTAFAFSQSNQVQNAYNYLRNKELDKAKASADAAIVHESTMNNAKAWMYRGKVYQAIYFDTSKVVRAYDNESAEKSLESYIKCLKLDKDGAYKDEVKGPLVQATAAVSNKANAYKVNKEFEKALNCYDLLEQALPYDFDQGMKRANITKEKLMFNKFETYRDAANKAKMMETADKLIAINYKEPRIYTNMVKICLIDRDTTKALDYIAKGKAMFEDNMELVNQEINIYLARNKTDELKTKLNSAIELSPDNEVLHAILANLYVQTKESDKAEEEYLKALDIKSDYDVANYNLGVIYFNKGNEWNTKLGDLPPKETAKAKEYEAKANEYFKKAVVNFEKSYEVSPDKATKQQLFKLFSRLGEAEKAAKYK